MMARLGPLGKKKPGPFADRSRYRYTEFDRYHLPDNIKHLLRPEYFGVPGDGIASLVEKFWNVAENSARRRDINKPGKLLDKVLKCSPSLRADLDGKINFIIGIDVIKDKFIAISSHAMEQHILAEKKNDIEKWRSSGLELTEHVVAYRDILIRHFATHQTSIRGGQYEKHRESLHDLKWPDASIVHAFFRDFDILKNHMEFIIHKDFENHFANQDATLQEGFILVGALFEASNALFGLAEAVVLSDG